MNRRAFVKSTAAAWLVAQFRSKLSFAVNTDDPLLAPWTGPHGGFPRFDLIKPQMFKPGILRAMDLQRAEIAAIVKAPPSFDATIVALEDTGRAFNRSVAIFGVYRST